MNNYKLNNMMVFGNEINIKKFLTIIACAAFAWFLAPVPSGLSAQAWHMFIIFVATMSGIIIEAMPMVGVLFVSLLISSLTGTVNLKTHGFTGFSNMVPWLLFFIVSASRTITNSTIGPRIAYFFMRIFGKTVIGLAYSISISELVLSIILPSNTARSACLGFPVVKSLSQYIGSNALGGFLTLVYASATAVCSAIFLTGMVSNALILDAADKNGLHITWMAWFGYAAIPCLILLIIYPIILYFISSPKVANMGEVRKEAMHMAKELGPLSSKEKKILSVYGLMLVMWILADIVGVSILTTSILGICIFLFMGILSIKDVLSDDSTMKTVLMMGILISYSSCLQEYGVIGWFNDSMGQVISSYPQSIRLYTLAIIYFLGRYFFSGEGAYISALNIPFILTGLSLGIDKTLLIMTLAVFSSFSGLLSNYGGPAPILMYSTGYVSAKKWMTIGFVMSVISIFVWFSCVNLGLTGLK